MADRGKLIVHEFRCHSHLSTFAMVAFDSLHVPEPEKFPRSFSRLLLRRPAPDFRIQGMHAQKLAHPHQVN